MRQSLFLLRKPSKLYICRNPLISYTNSDLFRAFKVCCCIQDKKTGNGNIKLPEEPQNCCMSGCANCVWIEYAKEVAKILNDEGETAYNIIQNNIKDPNLKAFLLLELDHIFKTKKN